MWWFVVGFFSSKLHKMRIPPFLKGLLGRPGPQILDDAWVLRPGSDRDLWAAGGGLGEAVCSSSSSSRPGGCEGRRVLPHSPGPFLAFI